MTISQDSFACFMMIDNNATLDNDDIDTTKISDMKSDNNVGESLTAWSDENDGVEPG